MFCFCFLQLKDAEKHEIFNLDIALIFLSLEFIGRIDFSRFFEPPREWKLVFEKSGVHFILIYAKEEKKLLSIYDPVQKSVKSRFHCALKTHVQESRQYWIVRTN